MNTDPYESEAMTVVMLRLFRFSTVSDGSEEQPASNAVRFEHSGFCRRTSPLVRSVAREVTELFQTLISVHSR